MSDAKIDQNGQKVSHKTDEWDTLQKNVSQILKIKISIEDLKHIVAVINVMENAGIEFEKSLSATPITSQMIDYSVHGLTKSDQVYRDIMSNQDAESFKYQIENNIEPGSKRITFEIDDNLISSLRPESLRRVIYEKLVNAVRVFKGWV